jgi:hypothetical protein
MAIADNVANQEVFAAKYCVMNARKSIVCSIWHGKKGSHEHGDEL